MQQEEYSYTKRMTILSHFAHVRTFKEHESGRTVSLFPPGVGRVTGVVCAAASALREPPSGVAAASIKQMASLQIEPNTKSVFRWEIDFPLSLLTVNSLLSVTVQLFSFFIMISPAWALFSFHSFFGGIFLHISEFWILYYPPFYVARWWPVLLSCLPIPPPPPTHYILDLLLWFFTGCCLLDLLQPCVIWINNRYLHPCRLKKGLVNDMLSGQIRSDGMKKRKHLKAINSEKCWFVFSSIVYLFDTSLSMTAGMKQQAIQSLFHHFLRGKKSIQNIVIISLSNHH